MRQWPCSVKHRPSEVRPQHLRGSQLDPDTQGVLAHCTRQRLPNLARVIGAVLPESMDEDDDEADDSHASRDLGEEEGGGK